MLQYPYMKERIPQKGDLGENKKAADELKGFKDGHVSDLFDMNEDAAGETRDLATGKPIDNSKSDFAHGRLTTVEPGKKDALPPLREKNDAAAQWLRENGG